MRPICVGWIQCGKHSQELTAALMEVTRGDEMPDLGILGRRRGSTFTPLTAIQRLEKAEKAQGGFRTLTYDGCLMAHAMVVTAGSCFGDFGATAQPTTSRSISFRRGLQTSCARNGSAGRSGCILHGDYRGNPCCSAPALTFMRLNRGFIVLQDHYGIKPTVATSDQRHSVVSNGVDSRWRVRLRTG